MLLPRPILSTFFCCFIAAGLSAQGPVDPCDTMLIVAQATHTNLTCTNPVATLTGALHPTALGYQWSGPGGFSAAQRITQNFVPGVYTLTVSGPSGCTAQTTVTVQDDCTNVSLWPPECDYNPFPPPPADDCADVCVRTQGDIASLGTTVGYTAGIPPNGWCGTIENDQWYAFVAGSTGGTITAIPFNCTNGDGLQIGLYPDCNGSLPIACEVGAQGGGNTPVSITVDNLLLGKVYFLIIDGYAGDQCEFILDAPITLCTIPTPQHDTLPELVGPVATCPGAFGAYEILHTENNTATAFLWTAPLGSLINGEPTPALFYKPEGTTVDIMYGQQSGFVCVREIYYFYPPSPPLCVKIDNQPIPPTVLPDVTVCFEDFPYELPWGGFASAPGIYQFTDQSYLGCDSVIKLKVIGKPPVVHNLGTFTLCSGECFEFGGINYCQAGANSAILQSVQGCDSVVNFILVFPDPVAEIQGGVALTCAQTSVVLGSAPSQGVKTWSDASGQAIGTGNTLNVDQPGLYILTTNITVNGMSCQQSDTVLIEQNLNPPTVAATGGTLTCVTWEVQLQSAVSDPQAFILWTDPTGSTTTDPNPIVWMQGQYVLTATGLNGCQASATVSVDVDLYVPSVNVSADTLTCVAQDAHVYATPVLTGLLYTWTGPDGFTADEAAPAITTPGIYSVVVTNQDNGCTTSDAIEVIGASDLPKLLAFQASPACGDSVLYLQAGSATPGVTYTWTGPGSFFSEEEDPLAVLPGWYKVVVSDAGGCTASVNVLAVAAPQIPHLTGLNDAVLTCLQPSLMLQAGSDQPVSVYAWSGPNGFASSLSNPVIEAPGVYTLTITAVNGCTAEQSMTVVDSCLTGVSDLQKRTMPDVRLYPNASSGIVFVEALNAAGFDALRVYATDGRLIWSADFDTPQARRRLDGTNWPAGVYRVSARLGSQWMTKQLVLVE